MGPWRAIAKTSHVNIFWWLDPRTGTHTCCVAWAAVSFAFPLMKTHRVRVTRELARACAASAGVSGSPLFYSYRSSKCVGRYQRSSGSSTTQCIRLSVAIAEALVQLYLVSRICLDFVSSCLGVCPRCFRASHVTTHEERSSGMACTQSHLKMRLPSAQSYTYIFCLTHK